MAQEAIPIIGIRIIPTLDSVDVFPEVVHGMNYFLELITEVDRTLSGENNRTLDWQLQKLSFNSPAVAETRPIVRENQPDNRQLLIDTVISGMASLKEHSERPRSFSDNALVITRRIASLLGESVDGVELFDNRISVACSETIITNVREILRADRRMLGSVEGRLELLNSHGGFKFALYEPVLGSRINCEIDSAITGQEFENLKRRIINLYERRAVLTGVLFANSRGEIRSIRVSSLSERPRGRKFTEVSDIAGIYDITGGEEAEEYVRRIRDA